MAWALWEWEENGDDNEGAETSKNIKDEQYQKEKNELSESAFTPGFVKENILIIGLTMFGIIVAGIIGFYIYDSYIRTHYEDVLRKRKSEVFSINLDSRSFKTWIHLLNWEGVTQKIHTNLPPSGNVWCTEGPCGLNVDE